jgi:DNA-binding phage protein
MALRHVINARLNMAQPARKLRLNRAGLYRALSEAGNPGWKTVVAILTEPGMKSDLAES